MSLYWFAIIAYVAHELPLWFWASAAITIIHTVEESAGAIWDELGIPAPVYFIFQAFVLWLGCYAFLTGDWLWPFIAIRLGDVSFTHVVLRKPGILTSPLLLVDAFILAEWYG